MTAGLGRALGLAGIGVIGGLALVAALFGTDDLLKRARSVIAPAETPRQAAGPAPTRPEDGRARAQTPAAPEADTGADTGDLAALDPHAAPDRKPQAESPGAKDAPPGSAPGGTSREAPSRPSSGSPSAASEPAPVEAPSLDLIRVEPSGEAVIAGRGAPNAAVEVLRDNQPIARVVADRSGQFAIVPPALPPGSSEITLRSVGADGKAKPGRESVAVVVAKERDAKPLVAVSEPDKPTRVLSQPDDPADEPVRTKAEPGTDRAEAGKEAPGQAASGKKAPGKEASGKETLRKPAAKESGKEPAKEFGKEPAKELAKAPAEEPAKAPAEEPAKAPAEEPAKAPAKEPAKEPAKAEAGGTSGRAAGKPGGDPGATPPQREAALKTVAKPEGEGVPVKIVAVDAQEGGRLFVSGQATAWASLRLYLNDTLVASGRSGADGRIAFTIGRGVKPGGYQIRIDQVESETGKVRTRAQVAFAFPPQLAAREPVKGRAKGPDRAAEPIGREAAARLPETPPAAPKPVAEPVSSEPSQAPSRGQAARAQPEEKLSAQRPPAQKPAAEKPAVQDKPVDETPAREGPVASREAAPAPSGPGAESGEPPRRTGADRNAGTPAAAPPPSPEKPAVAAPSPEAGGASGPETPASPAQASPPDLPGSVFVPEITTARIIRGDNLWQISRRTYGDGRRYTVIYGANQDQIRDPDLIYPGQIFVLPKDEPTKDEPAGDEPAAKRG